MSSTALLKTNLMNLIWNDKSSKTFMTQSCSFISFALLPLEGKRIKDENDWSDSKCERSDLSSLTKRAQTSKHKITSHTQTITSVSLTTFNYVECRRAPVYCSMIRWYTSRQKSIYRSRHRLALITRVPFEANMKRVFFFFFFFEY